MSWLKSTIGQGINKVREKGAALKESEALKALQEKTTNAVASAATQVRNVKAARVSTVADLESQLEQAARNTRKPTALADLHRFWAQQVAKDPKEKDSQTYKRAEENERPLGFREVLLRSRALELTIETIASDAALRGTYSEQPTPEEKTSPAASLHLLLSRTLSVPTELWSEVLRLATSSDGLGEGHSAWLVDALSAMKMDWREEVYVAERKEKALRAEYLRQEIKQLEGQQGADESGEQCRRRVSASLELLQTYQAVRRNLEEAQTHRREMLAARDRDLGHIIEQIMSHMVGLQSSAQTSTERQKHLEGELKQSHDSIQVQLQNMAETRGDIDREIEELEERKRKLRMELEEVSRQLDETRRKQREHMEKCDKQRSEVDSQMATTKDKIAAEDAVVKDSEREKSIIERTQRLLRDTDGVVQRTLGGQLEELQKKQSQFHDHFQELLGEHLGHAEVQLQQLRSRAEDPQANAGAAEAVIAAEAEFKTFMAEYQELLKGAEVEAKVQALQAGYAAVVAQVSPTSTEEAAEKKAAVETSAAEVPSKTVTEDAQLAESTASSPEAVKTSSAEEVAQAQPTAAVEEVVTKASESKASPEFSAVATTAAAALAKAVTTAASAATTSASTSVAVESPAVAAAPAPATSASTAVAASTSPTLDAAAAPAPATQAASTVAASTAPAAAPAEAAPEPAAATAPAEGSSTFQPPPRSHV